MAGGTLAPPPSARIGTGRKVRENGRVPSDENSQNPAVNQQPEGEPQATPQAEPDAASVAAPVSAAGATSPASEPTGDEAGIPASAQAPQAARAPLPGEPGFKAPLTAKQLKRANQTIKGMFISVGLTLAVALPVVFLNPASNKETYDQQRVDVAQMAQIAQQQVTTQNFKALSPQLPEGWYANRASWNAGAADGVAFWSLGIIKGDSHYADVKQTDQANPSWISLVTDGSLPTGEKVDIDGTAWEQRVLPLKDKPKTLLTAKLGRYTYVVTADQGDDEFLAETAKIVQNAAPRD